MAENKKLSLEEAIEKLEMIVSEMENDKLPLEKSLKLYEEGVRLVALCSEELDVAKRRIEILQSGKNGEIELAPLGGSVN